MDFTFYALSFTTSLPPSPTPQHPFQRASTTHHTIYTPRSLQPPLSYYLITTLLLSLSLSLSVCFCLFCLQMLEPTAATSSDSGHPGSSETKYRGVRKRKWGKWVSEIRLPNSRERIWLGSYDSPEKAARAFDAALFCLRGRGANFNFPDSPPDIPGGESLSRPEIQLAAARFANDELPKESQPDLYQYHHHDSYTPSSSLSEHLDNETTMDGCFWSIRDYSYIDGGGLGISPPSPMDEGGGEDLFQQSSFLWNF